MAAFDGGKYIEVVRHGDIHWENAKALFNLPADTVRDDHNPVFKRYLEQALEIIESQIGAAVA